MDKTLSAIEPTIRLSTCRQDGRCPECDQPVASSWSETAALCGCTPCGTGCFVAHERALLTEALRQLSERTNADIQRGISYVLSIRCKRHWNVPQMNATEARGGECAACAVENMNQVLATIRTHEMEAEERAKRMEEERDSAIRERDEARAHDAQPYPTADERVCAALEATKRSLEQTRAAMEAGDACTVCAGTGKPVSGKPCICGGHGGIGNQIIGLTREVQRERERASRAEALLRYIRDHTGLSAKAPLLAKIREVLG